MPAWYYICSGHPLGIMSVAGDRLVSCYVCSGFRFLVSLYLRSRSAIVYRSPAPTAQRRPSVAFAMAPVWWIPQCPVVGECSKASWDRTKCCQSFVGPDDCRDQLMRHLRTSSLHYSSPKDSLPTTNRITAKHIRSSRHSPSFV